MSSTLAQCGLEFVDDHWYQMRGACPEQTALCVLNLENYRGPEPHGREAVHIISTVQRTKLCRSELSASDAMRGFHVSRPFVLLSRILILRHCDAFATNFTEAEFHGNRTRRSRFVGVASRRQIVGYALFRARGASGHDLGRRHAAAHDAGPTAILSSAFISDLGVYQSQYDPASETHGYIRLAGSIRCENTNAIAPKATPPVDTLFVHLACVISARRRDRSSGTSTAGRGHAAVTGDKLISRDNANYDSLPPPAPPPRAALAPPANKVNYLLGPVSIVMPPVEKRIMTDTNVNNSEVTVKTEREEFEEAPKFGAGDRLTSIIDQLRSASKLKEKSSSLSHKLTASESMLVDVCVANRFFTFCTVDDDGRTVKFTSLSNQKGYIADRRRIEMTANNNDCQMSSTYKSVEKASYNPIKVPLLRTGPTAPETSHILGDCAPHVDFLWHAPSIVVFQY
ncbi:hypothetical protein EVAR_45913_1 [Eumeta japonica]|uniref:Uncharacterized protein n=1 Tax=Eumeta variegata TaxID=151549 RepID=A0A4C1W650_EUMVA|nr:hypothetical protein EVAR_45913_1 [Eumeta japonica]